MTNPLVFIAGPYSSDPTANTRRSIEVQSRLLDVGIPSICPHLSHFADLVSPRPYDDWLGLACAQLEQCGRVLRIKGESTGADHEVRHAARNDIPVWFEEHGSIDHFIESILGPPAPVVLGTCPIPSPEYDVSPNRIGNRSW